MNTDDLTEKGIDVPGIHGTVLSVIQANADGLTYLVYDRLWDHFMGPFKQWQEAVSCVSDQNAEVVDTKTMERWAQGGIKFHRLLSQDEHSLAEIVSLETQRPRRGFGR